MGRLVWRATAALALIAVLGVACKDEGPDGPAAIAAVAGGGQEGPFGDPLPTPLTVTVTGTGGTAFPNAQVNWQVIGGSASLSKTTGNTNANGRDSVTVTLGTAAGVVTVQATTANLPPASFTLTAVDGCAWLHTLNIPGSKGGTLRPFDCDLGDGTSVDFFLTNVPTAQWTTFGMASDSLDAFLWLFTLSQDIIALSDDIDPGVITNTAMRILVPPGDYVVGANSFGPGEQGPYSLTANQTAVNVAACGEYWVGWDVVLSDNIATTDCNDGAGAFSDGVLIVLHAGQSLTATMTSSVVDAFLRLHDQNGVVASDDNTAGGTDARLTFTSSPAAVYLLEAATATAGETGAYTLTVVASAPLVAAAPVSPGGERLRRPDFELLRRRPKSP